MKINTTPWVCTQVQTLCSSHSLCNLIVLSLSFFLFFGCDKEDPIPLTESITQKIQEEKQERETTKVPKLIPVPQPASEIFKYLPEPPPQLVRPHQSINYLKKMRPNLIKSPYSDSVLTEELKEGPFSVVVYHVDSKTKKINSVSATFHPNYMNPIQLKRLKTYMGIQLGKGKKFTNSRMKQQGTRWSTLDYRIELQIDTKINDLVLLFHIRGAETLERTRKKFLPLK
jgi:hypothetical protein